MITLAIIIYCAVTILAIRPLAGHFAWRHALSDHNLWPSLYPIPKAPRGEDWFTGVTVALALVSVWPLTLASIGVWKLGSRDVWKIGAERRIAREQAAQRLEQAEREVGLR